MYRLSAQSIPRNVLTWRSPSYSMLNVKLESMSSVRRQKPSPIERDKAEIVLPYFLPKTPMSLQRFLFPFFSDDVNFISTGNRRRTFSALFFAFHPLCPKWAAAGHTGGKVKVEQSKCYCIHSMISTTTTKGKLKHSNTRCSPGAR